MSIENISSTIGLIIYVLSDYKIKSRNDFACGMQHIIKRIVNRTQVRILEIIT